MLEEYGVGPWSCRTLNTYWDRIWVVALMGEYYGADFQGFRG